MTILPKIVTITLKILSDLAESVFSERLRIGAHCDPQDLFRPGSRMYYG